MPKVKCKKCQNKQCGVTNPLEAKFCRKCGSPISDNAEILVCEVENSNVEMDSRPFHLKHPELHLKPISEFQELSFLIKSPEYVEDPLEAEDSEYLYIARKGKLGVLYWTVEKHWYGKDNVYDRIIPCEYDRIDKADGHFVCYKGSQVTYIDLKGNILK